MTTSRKKPVKQETKLGFKAVSKDCLKAYVGNLFTFVGKQLCFCDTMFWNAEVTYIDNRSKTLSGYVLDENRLMVKTLLDDGKILWIKKTSLLRLLLLEERTDDGLKQVLAEKIEILSKPEAQGLSISDTKEILQQCLAALNHIKPVQDGSSK